MRRRKDPGILPTDRVVLGVDPGAVHLGWAVLRGGRFVDCGTVELVAMSRPSVAKAIRILRWVACRETVAAVVVERVELVNARPGFGSTMATGLAHGHGVGQRVVQAFLDDGLPVLEVAAETWHLEFFGQRAVDAPSVAALLARYVAGWPAPRTRGVDGHARDAGAIALWGHARLGEKNDPA